MKTILKMVVSVAIAVVLLLGGFIGFLTVTEYKPDPREQAQILGVQGIELDPAAEFTITSFNIGYAALDKDTDFFMDGGTMSRGLSKEKVTANLKHVIDFLADTQSDIYLIQEVDEKATRSYGVNQRTQISSSLSNYNSSFGINYKVAWVPVPLHKPMGQVLSGIQTLTKFSLAETTRYTLPGEYPWPTRLAQLDRCMLVSRISLPQAELVIGHIHLSAFDQGGFIRNQQLQFLEDFAKEEYAKGNYVVIGGDWNHLLAANPLEKRARHSANWPDWLQLLPADFLTDFQWAFDESIPSNRTMEAPYNPEKTFTANIDGFLVSPNLEIVAVAGHDLGFEFSDHNPVTVKLRLKQEALETDEEEQETSEEV